MKNTLEADKKQSFGKIELINNSELLIHFQDEESAQRSRGIINAILRINRTNNGSLNFAILNCNVQQT